MMLITFNICLIDLLVTARYVQINNNKQKLSFLAGIRGLIIYCLQSKMEISKWLKNLNT